MLPDEAFRFKYQIAVKLDRIYYFLHIDLRSAKKRAVNTALNFLIFQN
jgi:hypothetical protein